MKKLLFFAFAAALCCGLTACGGDDDNNGGGDATYEELIVGTWETYKEFWYDGNGWDYDFGPGIFQLTHTFNANGTYIQSGAEWWQGGKETWTDRGTYILSGKRMVIIEDDGYTTEMEIMTLNNSELVVKSFDKGVLECDIYMCRL